MNSDWIVLGVGVVAVVVLALTAVWYGLFVKVKTLKTRQSTLQNHFRARHDLIPLLVESYGAASSAQGVSKVVERLVEERKKARLAKGIKDVLKREEELEVGLKQLVKEGQKIESLKKDIGWLEARTELQKITEGMGEALEEYERARGALAAQSLRFPARLFRGYAKKYL